MRARKRLRWRVLLRELLTEVRDGVLTPLERHYARDVERAHGLPHGRRNKAEGSGPTRRSRDVRYRRYRLVVELDGRAAHPPEERELDDLRDNEVTVRDEVTLRYGWRTVRLTPCLAAQQVGEVLARNGWTGRLRPCGPDCAVNRRGFRGSDG